MSGEAKPWKRLSVNVALDVAEAIQSLAVKNGGSITETIRRAVSLYKFLDDEASAGNKVLVERSDRLFEVKFL